MLGFFCMIIGVIHSFKEKEKIILQLLGLIMCSCKLTAYSYNGQKLPHELGELKKKIFILGPECFPLYPTLLLDLSYDP